MYLYQGFIELKIWGEGNGGRGGRGVGLSQLFQKIYRLFYSRFLHHFPYYSSTFDLLFSHYSCFSTISKQYFNKPAVNAHLPREITQSWCLQSMKYKSRETWRSFADTRRSCIDIYATILRWLSQPRGIHGPSTTQVPSQWVCAICIFRYILLIILFLFSKSCPIILQIIPEYLAQA